MIFQPCTNVSPILVILTESMALATSSTILIQFTFVVEFFILDDDDFLSYKNVRRLINYLFIVCLGLSTWALLVTDNLASRDESCLHRLCKFCIFQRMLQRLLVSSFDVKLTRKVLGKSKRRKSSAADDFLVPPVNPEISSCRIVWRKWTSSGCHFHVSNWAMPWCRTSLKIHEVLLEKLYRLGFDDLIFVKVLWLLIWAHKMT